MEEENLNEKVPFDSFYKVIIAESVCVVLILLSALCVKFFFAETFYDLKEWYTEHICDTTDINEVLGEKNDL